MKIKGYPARVSKAQGETECIAQSANSMVFLRYMRHCLHPVTFAEWIARQRHLLAGKTMPAAELIDRLRERGNGVQP